MRCSGRFAVRAVLTTLLTAGCLALPAGAATRPQQAQSPPPKALILVNAETGEVLIADKEHDPLPVASLAKVMTAVTAVERLPVDATITVGELAAAQPASRINMVAGQQWRFQDALASLLMASANDAAYAIAENAGTSLDGFAAAMAETGERLGMDDSTYSDPAGFDDEASFGGGPLMSAFDVAIATRNAQAVPEIATLAATETLDFVDPTGANRNLVNHNKMLPNNTRAYEGATGFKTGYTDQAGNTFVGTAERNGCSLIAVVLGTYDTYGWAAQLMDQGFAMNCQAEGDTAERLPDVAVWPYAQRVDDQRGFVALARGPNPTTTTSTVPTTSDLAAAAPAVTAEEDESGESGGGGGRDGGGGVFSVRNIALVALAGLVAAFFVRRRAVKQQRARRVASHRTRTARMRSGGLTVIDGRYRTGTRVGPPLESHVRVQRIEE